MPSTTPEELTGPQGHLELGELALLEGGRERLVLERDGTLHAPVEKRLVGTLKRDGRLLDAGGNLLAELTQEGEVVTAGGEFLPVTIDEHGGVHLLKENRVVRLMDDGKLTGANPNGPDVSFSGVTPDTRRTAMFLLVLSAYPVRPQP